MKDKTDPLHREKKEWLGGPFNPEKFDVKKVKFDDPKKRWKKAFEDPVEF